LKCGYNSSPILPIEVERNLEKWLGNMKDSFGFYGTKPL